MQLSFAPISPLWEQGLLLLSVIGADHAGGRLVKPLDGMWS